ncbi:uncharacterized protein [Arachis hypogaea]|uniref:Uncharacterized protein n=1 Tax=Arachis hypogaea TaxID=3818 RepID=A0A445BEV2_ARAHY|nr:uncharacterized protein LOC112713089 isoform X1 [Arachis hypogaea]QHO36007.1 uncharacterized protein DS421_9g280160 [Arachis hypogaea]RYR37213.1 hypothetical protein Ahy_A09g042136 [Arachis hypogaea]
MASYSVSCFFGASATSNRWQIKLSQPYPKIRLQCSKDNDKPADIVDANLSVLRARIEELKKRDGGWNYNKLNNNEYEVSRYKRNSKIVTEYVEMLGMACGAIGLVFLIGSISIYFVSLLVYISK